MAVTVGIHPVRELVWLATGGISRFWRMVSWEVSPFPISSPHLWDRDRYVATQAGSPVESVRNILPDLALRIGVLDGSNEVIDLEPDTEEILQVIRLQSGQAFESGDLRTVLLTAFAASQFSLTNNRSNGDEVAQRFSLFCGRSTEEARVLRDQMRNLNPVRDGIAHGAPPNRRAIARFAGMADVEAIADGRWLGFANDLDTDDALLTGLDILRKVYLTWLQHTLRVEGDRVVCNRNRDEVLRLLDRARSGETEAVNILRAEAVAASNGIGGW